MTESLRFTVVIPTCNRRVHLAQAIESVLQQTLSGAEIIVVDDASTDDTQQFVKQAYPQVRYLRQEQNRGPGPARQRGIREARHPWVVMLDDDDALHPDGLQTIAASLAQWPPAEQYPVFFFMYDCTWVPGPFGFQILSFARYLAGAFDLDMLPVYQRARYLDAGLSYPQTRLGGEALLFWRAALEFGIPVWEKRVGHVGTDAALRLTNVNQQIARAREHAELQEMALAEFGRVLAQYSPTELRRRHLGAATYWLLAGYRRKVLPHLAYLVRTGRFVKGALLFLLLFIPTSFARYLFLNYRRITAPNTYQRTTTAK